MKLLCSSHYIWREKSFLISAKVVSQHGKRYYCIGNLFNMADGSSAFESFTAGLYDGAIRLGVHNLG
jgi:hypothetical protein